MELFSFFFSGLIPFLLLPPPAACSCGPSESEIISLAFRSVSGFQPPPPAADAPDCSVILPSRNLSGAVSWMHLHNVSALRALDLSGNALRGSIPRGFWSAPALLHVNLAGNRLGGALRFGSGSRASPLTLLNLAGNRFTSAAGLAALPRLEILDLSRNRLGFVPPGLEKLRRLQHLDVSHNDMRGALPEGFPRLAAGLGYLNVSYNNISGVVQQEAVEKFGESAFVKAGSLQFARVAHSSSPTPSAPRRRTHRRTRWRAKKAITLGVIPSIAAVAVIVGVLLCVLCVLKKEEEKEGGGEGTGGEVVAEGGGAVQKPADRDDVVEGVSAGRVVPP